MWDLSYLDDPRMTAYRKESCHGPLATPEHVDAASALSPKEMHTQG